MTALYHLNENIAHLLEGFLESAVPLIAGLAEIIGLFIIVTSLVKATYHYVRTTFFHDRYDFHHEMSTGLTTALEFLMSAEIAKTFLLQNLSTLAIAMFFTTECRASPFSVGTSFFCWRTIYSRLSRVSMMAARVAGVPIPLSFIAWRIVSSSISLPAVSDERCCAPLGRDGALLCPANPHRLEYQEGNVSI